MLKKNMRILHISCHGIKDSSEKIKKTARPKMGLSILAGDMELE